jgi:hypothetical protein
MASKIFSVCFAMVMSTGHTVTKIRVLLDGAAARKPAGKIAGYLQVKPRNTAAIPTRTKGILTTTNQAWRIAGCPDSSNATPAY